MTVTADDENEGRSSAGQASSDAGTSAERQLAYPFPEKISSMVPFHPHPKYWRIAGKFYDLTEFMDKHPGGPALIEMSRGRFDDATFAFEAHHHNYKKARAVLQRYYVRDVKEEERLGPDGEELPGKLLGDDEFYSTLRRRVTDHLKKAGDGGSGPTAWCVQIFWAIFVLWLSSFYLTYISGTIVSALVTGVLASWLGAFGHNWVHQPKYRFWATLSLDTVGFSSEAWVREHILQHHMYTNTEKDNHFRGTDPFLVTDPTVDRNWFQKCITPILNPLILSLGMWGNYIAHTTFLLKGEENFHWGKLILPVEVGFMVHRWGFCHGMLLMYTMYAVLGCYYFTMALMNHNAEHCTDVKRRNASKDWGVSQLNSSADWGVDLTFNQAIIYLWLNYHTVHHLFPHIDMSKHPAIQTILIDTCKEFKVDYVTSSPAKIYMEMIQSFSSPYSLGQQVMTYSGGL
jgi:fatty acid desaturase